MAQSVPRNKHSVSVIKTIQLMLYREIISVYSQIHTKHINTLCGQNVDFVILNLMVVHKCPTKGSCKYLQAVSSVLRLPFHRLAYVKLVFIFLATTKMRPFLCLRPKTANKSALFSPCRITWYPAGWGGERALLRDVE